MIKIPEKLRSVVYLTTAIIVIVSWVNLMFFIVDGDVPALLLTPILFFAVVYLIGGLVLWWKSRKSNTNEFVISQSQQRFADFYIFFLFLAVIILAVNVFSIVTMGFNGLLAVYYDKFLVWVFNNL